MRKQARARPALTEHEMHSTSHLFTRAERDEILHRVGCRLECDGDSLGAELAPLCVFPSVDAWEMLAERMIPPHEEPYTTEWLFTLRWNFSNAPADCVALRRKERVTPHDISLRPLVVRALHVALRELSELDRRRMLASADRTRVAEADATAQRHLETLMTRADAALSAVARRRLLASVEVSLCVQVQEWDLEKNEITPTAAVIGQSVCFRLAEAGRKSFVVDPSPDRATALRMRPGYSFIVSITVRLGAHLGHIGGAEFIAQPGANWQNEVFLVRDTFSDANAHWRVMLHFTPARGTADVGRLLSSVYVVHEPDEHQEYVHRLLQLALEQERQLLEPLLMSALRQAREAPVRDYLGETCARLVAEDRATPLVRPEPGPNTHERAEAYRQMAASGRAGAPSTTSPPATRKRTRWEDGCV